MTIPATASQISYAGNGVTLAFDIPFVFDTDDDIKVIVTDADGEPTELSTGFAITGGGGSTGTCTFTVAPAVDTIVTILDDPELTQTSDYESNDAFPEESHERALDRGTRQVKRQFQRLERTIRVKDGDLVGGDELLLPIASARYNKFMGFNSIGQPVMLSGTGDDAALRDDLAAGVSGLVLGEAVAHDRTNAEAGSSIALINPHILPGIDYRYGVTGDGTTDDTVATQAAIDTFNATDNFSYSINLPDGTRSVANVTFYNRTRLIGQSIEGTRYKARPGTSGAWFNDDGSSAKVEMYNITFDANGEVDIDAVLRLGVDDIQFGTYGCIDNIMARGAPNGIGFDIDANAVVCGKLYTLDCASGLISSAAGSGFHAEAVTPYGFTDIGIQLAKGDSINYVEAEAPGADTAVPLIYERGGYVANFYLSIGPGRVVRTPMRINTEHVGHWMLGSTTVNYANTLTSKFGDTVDPDESGTASSGAATTLTDSSKTWTREQWVGAALHITSGTGSGQWRRIAGNSKDTLTIVGSWDTNPDNTSAYKLSYFIRKATGPGASHGFGHSDSLTAYWPWFQHVSVGGQIATDKLVVGKSNDSAAVTGIMKVVATLNFGSVSANAVGTPLTVNVVGAQVGMPVVLGIPDAIAQLGLVLTPTVSSAGVVSIYPKNLTGSPIDPPSATVVVTVLDYA